MKPSIASGQKLGTAVTWTATSSGLTSPVYRFSVQQAGSPAQVVRDFAPAASFVWTPMHEGSYTILAAAKSGFAATTVSQTSSTFAVKSRVAGSTPVVGATSNPLVALYSAPACAGGTVVVRFRAAVTSPWQSTAPQVCKAGQSVNFIVAGMLPKTRYQMQHIVTSGGHATTSSPIAFTTGNLNPKLKYTPFTVKTSTDSLTDPTSTMLFHALNVSPSPVFVNPVATDRSGHLIWYYDPLQAHLSMIWPLHILSGGTVLLFGRDQSRKTGDDVLREIDLAGNSLRETNIDAVNAQLTAKGQQIIYAFHHDALRLPNGFTAVLGETQKKVGTQDVMGDTIIVLDTNFQVVWTWDMFDHLTPPAKFPPFSTCDITYPVAATLCALPDLKSQDWTHANSLNWSAQDSDLTLSIRHLDWVIKIDYQNGHGSGKIVWRLGKGGDFTIKSSDPNPWFSHQHDPHFVNSTTIVLLDNGNTRCQAGAVKGCQSRGQELKIDEVHHVVTPVVNVNMGSFQQALGSAQLLKNGNVAFEVGYPLGHAIEFSPKGTIAYEIDAKGPEYRAYWLNALSF